jgi:hypothetical protein
MKQKQKGRAPLHGLLIPLIVKTKKPWSTFGVPHGLDQSIMFLRQQANPSYEVAPPPIIL